MPRIVHVRNAVLVLDRVDLKDAALEGCCAHGAVLSGCRVPEAPSWADPLEGALVAAGAAAAGGIGSGIGAGDRSSSRGRRGGT